MRKAQAFIQDLIIATVIMSMVIIIYFSFYTNQNLNNENVEESVFSEARTITEYLTTSGYPSDWNMTNVIRMGILGNDYAIRSDKLEMFSNMSRDDYDLSRMLLKTKYDYIIYFKDYEGNILNITNQLFIGKAGVNSTNIESVESPNHLSKIVRFVVLKETSENITSSRIVEMITYVWSD